MAIQNVTRMLGATGNAGYSAGTLITNMTVTIGRSYRFDRRQSFSKTFAALSKFTANTGFAGLVNAVARGKRLHVWLLP